MAIKPIGDYNEPRKTARGDRVPKLARPARGLTPIVRARLEMERTLRVCGNDVSPPLRLRPIHAQVLVTMLREADSPLSASLRARAAAAAGPLRIARAAPLLRNIVLDEHDDLLTRVNAVQSYVGIRGSRAAAELGTLLRARHPLVRAAIYVAALKAEPALAEPAAERFRKERDARIKAYVSRRVPAVRDGDQTEAD